MPRLLPAALLALAPLLALAACADVGDAPVAETTEAAGADTAAAFTGTALPLDTAATRVAWHAAKVTGAHDGGFRRLTGAIYLDGQRVTGTDVVIDAASIFTDNERLQNHLKSADFFDVAVYPEARFRATAFVPLTAADSVGWAGATHRVTGLLTMHGRTNRITFPARLAVTADSVTADADFLIDRQQWGLSYPGSPDNLIQDEVRIRLRAAAARGAGA